MTVTLKLLATMVIWGGTFIAGRLLAQDMGSFSAAFLRFLAASVFMALLTCRAEGRFPPLRRNMVLPALILGLTGIFLYNALFFTGLRQVAAGRASLIIAGTPGIIAVLSWIFLREAFPLPKALGVVLALAGAVVVITNGEPWTVLSGGAGMGELAILGCSLSWAAYTLAGRKALQYMSPLASVLWACIVGDALLLPMALAHGLAADLARSTLLDWGNILFLGVLGTGLGFSWYSQGIQAIGTSRAAVYINLVPICAMLMGFFFLGEPLSLSLGAGAVLVFTGVWLTNRPVAQDSSRAPA